MKKLKNLTIREILESIEFTVVIDGVEKSGRDVIYSTWMDRMVKASEKASGYTPAQSFDPVARDNFQNYIAVAFVAGLLPAKVVETRTDRVGDDGCWVFEVETFGTLDPYEDEEETEEAQQRETDPADADPAPVSGFGAILCANGKVEVTETRGGIVVNWTRYNSMEEACNFTAAKVAQETGRSPADVEAVPVKAARGGVYEIKVTIF